MDGHMDMDMGDATGMSQMTKHADDRAEGHSNLYFYISTEATILFQQWSVDSWLGLLMSCLGILIMALVKQIVVTAREWLRNMAKARLSKPDKMRRAMCDPYHLAQSLLEILDVFIGMCLMVIFMTLNTILATTVVIGYGLGYFLFRWRTDTNVYEEINSAT